MIFCLTLRRLVASDQSAERMTCDPQVFPQESGLSSNSLRDKRAQEEVRRPPLDHCHSPLPAEGYCLGAAGFDGVVARGRTAAGAEGAEGTGAATPDEALYAATTACVTSVL
jgi:hypothetical protein